MAFIIKEDHLWVGLAEASNDIEHWLIVYLQMKVSFLPFGKPTILGIYVCWVLGICLDMLTWFLGQRRVKHDPSVV